MKLTSICPTRCKICTRVMAWKKNCFNKITVGPDIARFFFFLYGFGTVHVIAVFWQWLRYETRKIFYTSTRCNTRNIFKCVTCVYIYNLNIDLTLRIEGRTSRVTFIVATSNVFIYFFFFKNKTPTSNIMPGSNNVYTPMA